MLVGAVSFLGAARGMLFNNAGDVPTARCNRHHHALATIQRMSSGHRMLASIPASVLIRAQLICESPIDSTTQSYSRNDRK
jgi:hypothetical protein